MIANDIFDCVYYNEFYPGGEHDDDEPGHQEGKMHLLGLLQML